MGIVVHSLLQNGSTMFHPCREHIRTTTVPTPKAYQAGMVYFGFDNDDYTDDTLAMDLHGRSCTDGPGPSLSRWWHRLLPFPGVGVVLGAPTPHMDMCSSRAFPAVRTYCQLSCNVVFVVLCVRTN